MPRLGHGPGEVGYGSGCGSDPAVLLELAGCNERYRATVKPVSFRVATGSTRFRCHRRVAAIALTGAALVAFAVPVQAYVTPEGVAVSDDTAHCADDDRTNCSSSHNNAGVIAGRNAADALDGEWLTATGHDKLSLFDFGESEPNGDQDILAPLSGYDMNMPDTNLVVTVQEFKIPNARAAVDQRTSTAAGSWGTPGTLAPEIRNNGDWHLQDDSPKPMRLIPDAQGGSAGYTGGNTRFWASRKHGPAATNSSVRFEFSEPVDNFGAWFGDMESANSDLPGRTPGYVKLYDENGNVLAVHEITDNYVNPQHECGGANSGDHIGCGNMGTRYIGFARPTADVKYFQVIVGDDDLCPNPQQPSATCDGSDEVFSFIGPQYASDAPALLITKNVVNDNFGTAAAADFDFQVTHIPAQGAPTSQTVQAQQEVPLEAGENYTVSEVAQAGYQLSGTPSCVDDDQNPVDPAGFTAGLLGTHVYCTFTNDDTPNPATLTLRKEVTNDDGGTAEPTDFTLTVERGGQSSNHASGDQVQLQQPTETLVGEAALAGYTQTGIACLDAQGNDVGNPFTPAAGQQITCTVSSDADPNPVAYVDPVADSDPDADPNSDAVAVAVTVADADPNADSVADADTNPVANSHADAYAVADRPAHANRHPAAGGHAPAAWQQPTAAGHRQLSSADE